MSTQMPLEIALHHLVHLFKEGYGPFLKAKGVRLELYHQIAQARPFFSLKVFYTNSKLQRMRRIIQRGRELKAAREHGQRKGLEEFVSQETSGGSLPLGHEGIGSCKR
jgi:hypothetical protein